MKVYFLIKTIEKQQTSYCWFSTDTDRKLRSKALVDLRVKQCSFTCILMSNQKNKK